MIRIVWKLSWLVLVLAGCRASVAPEATGTAAPSTLPPLPLAVANNAVAAVGRDDRLRLYSFMGLTAGKTWRDITDRAFEYRAANGRWREIDPVPGPPRLAATAETVAGKIYLFGGYTVGEDHSEVSRPEVLRYDPATGNYTALAPMPVPVDDTVSLVYRDRYVYLVSGWHDDDNVSNVQLYDTRTDKWLQASPYPGPAVFGHAGGIVGREMVICDGVRVVPRSEPGKRDFRISSKCYIGRIGPRNPTYIEWRSLPHHPGPALYRAGAAGDPASGQVLFGGGTDNPYNYDGTGYDGVPSNPSSTLFGYDLGGERWVQYPPLPAPSMDHRGLLKAGDRWLLVGGMDAHRAVTGRVLVFEVD